MKQKQKQNKTWQPYQTKTTFINALDGLFLSSLTIFYYCGFKG